MISTEATKNEVSQEIANGKHPLIIRRSTDPDAPQSRICDSFLDKHRNDETRRQARAALAACGFDPRALDRGLTDEDCAYIELSLYEIAHKPDPYAPADSLSLSDGLKHAPDPTYSPEKAKRDPYLYSTAEWRIFMSPTIQCLGDAAYAQAAAQNRLRISALQKREAVRERTAVACAR